MMLTRLKELKYLRLAITNASIVEFKDGFKAFENLNSYLKQNLNLHEYIFQSVFAR